jgi:hypothetical protein
MPMSRPNRVLLLVVTAVVAAAVVAGVLLATRDEPRYGPGTPEGVVQSYLEAVIAGDHQEAVRFLAPDSSCEVSDLDRAAVQQEVRAVLRETEIDGEDARVDVDLALSSGDLFAGDEYTEKHTFRLTRSDDTWLITGMPWPMYDCEE